MDNETSKKNMLDQPAVKAIIAIWIAAVVLFSVGIYSGTLAEKCGCRVEALSQIENTLVRFFSFLPEEKT